MEFMYGNWASNLGMELRHRFFTWNLDMEFLYGTWACNLGMEIGHKI